MATKQLTKNQNSVTIRPPVVCVLGHVDHGKTTLLDYIRKTKIASHEAGGITQHIGAYQIKLKNKKEVITFIDTPGHAAFSKLRSRGAEVADLAILVIDAVEGLKPQTIESINHIKEANIPFLVAINKIDLPGSNMEMVKGQLAEKGILVEGYGGDVVTVGVSAKTGEGIDELLEMIILLAQMQPLKTESKSLFKGVVIETRMDPKRGLSVTLLVKEGSLKTGDLVISDEIEGRIKAMFDENGRKVNLAGPSKPVEVFGFKKAPRVGSQVVSLKEDLWKSCRKKRLNREKVNGLKKVEQENQGQPEEKKVIKVILKADVTGCLEAIKGCLAEEVNVISEGIGEVNESDILLAASTKAFILAFRVAIPKQVKKLADYEKVKIISYDVIYKLLEDLEKQVLKLIEPEIEEEILGEAKVIAEFKIRGNHIAGCHIKKGKLSLNNQVHIKRNGVLLANTRIKFMQKNRQNVESVKEKDEAGLVFSPDVDFKLGDDIIAYNN
jgi:translation initiation factor IF-2